MEKKQLKKVVESYMDYVRKVSRAISTVEVSFVEDMKRIGDNKKIRNYSTAIGYSLIGFFAEAKYWFGNAMAEEEFASLDEETKNKVTDMINIMDGYIDNERNLRYNRETMSKEELNAVLADFMQYHIIFNHFEIEK